jgi:hypothetical protein
MNVKLTDKQIAILLGTLIGATVGAGAAWTYTRQREAKLQEAALGEALPIKMNASAGELIKIGVALMALLRQFDDLFKP